MAGKARQGKNTVGELLAERLGYKTYALAEPIKAFVNALCGWGPYLEYDNVKEHLFPVFITAKTIADATAVAKQYGLVDYVSKRKGEFLISEILSILGITTEYPSEKTPRELYQLMGTEYGRVYVDDNIWIDLMPTEATIITDVRFPNEAAAIRELGGTVIHVYRDNEEVKGGIAGHASEVGLAVELGDYVFDNIGGMGDLRDNIEKLIELLA